jgi:hypothetical protein
MTEPMTDTVTKCFVDFEIPISFHDHFLLHDFIVRFEEMTTPKSPAKKGGCDFRINHNKRLTRQPSSTIFW